MPSESVSGNAESHVGPTRDRGKTYCRWESGSYIQSEAFDRYLRLLIVRESNVHFLDEIAKGRPIIASSESVDEFQETFGSIRDIRTVLERSRTFVDLFARGELADSVKAERTMFVVTFYSYKGGVGRTLALVNCAFRLAKQGKKVFILDFDLEAPGVDSFRSLGSNGQSTKGVVEYINRFRSEGRVEDIDDYVRQVRPVALGRERFGSCPPVERMRHIRFC